MSPTITANNVLFLIALVVQLLIKMNVSFALKDIIYSHQVHVNNVLFLFLIVKNVKVIPFAQYALQNITCLMELVTNVLLHTTITILPKLVQAEGHQIALQQIVLILQSVRYVKLNMY